MTKEEVVQEIKNSIVDCMSLIDEENVDGCIDKMLNLCHKLVVNNQVTIKDDLLDLTNKTIDKSDVTIKDGLLALINKIIDKSDVRIQKLNNLVDYIETTVWYMENTDHDASSIENYIDHIAKVKELDEMDRCYILTKITRDKCVTCYAGQIIARGLFKSIEG